jgi:N-acetylglutamate synthase-like GNAT family acetyltransferase
MTHLTDLLAIDRCTPDAAVFNARKMLIEADLVHAVRALRARKARDVESNRQVRNVAEGLARRYDARIAATKRVAQIRCFQLEKGWKTTSEIRCLAIHPRPRQDV